MAFSSSPDDDPYEVATKAAPPPLNKIVRGVEKLKGVQPDLLNHWNNLQGEFGKAGITPEIKSGYRTTAQQQALYSNPATRALTKGNDGINQISPHQDGRALDISFPASQRAKGRQIIASYAQQNGLHVPSSEPWHIAVPKQPDDPFAVVGAQQSTRSAPQSETDDPFVVATQPQGRSAAMANVVSTPRRQARGKADTGWGAGPVGQGVTVSPLRRRTANVEGEAQPSEGTKATGFIRGMAEMAGLPTQLLPADTGDYINETVAKATPALMRGLSGAIKVAPRIASAGIPNPLVENMITPTTQPLRRSLNEGADHLAQGVQAIDKEANRGMVSQEAQNLVAGSISSSPAMILTGLGVPAPVAFGAQSYLEAEGRDAAFKDIVKETAKGATIGALFELPLPAKQGILNEIGRRVTKAGIVGGGTELINRATGQSDPKGALINALFAASSGGAERHEVAEPAQTVPDALQAKLRGGEINSALAAREAAVKPSLQPEQVPAMRIADQTQGAQPIELPQARYPETRYPENLGVVGPTKPVEGIEEGAKLNRWQHGRVRVLAEDGTEHIIQRPKGTGAGNQIAVPLRPKVTDTRLQDEAAQAAENAPFKVTDRRGQNEVSGNQPSEVADAARTSARLAQTPEAITSPDRAVAQTQEASALPVRGAVPSESAVVPLHDELSAAPRHVDLQPRRQRGDGRGQFKEETKAQRESRLAQVSPSEAATPPQVVTSKDAAKLGEIQAIGKRDRSVRDRGDGTLGMYYENGPSKGGYEGRTIVPFETQPRKGLTPVEIWNGGKNAKNVHFGNEITEVRGREAKPNEPTQTNTSVRPQPQSVEAGTGKLPADNADPYFTPESSTTSARKVQLAQDAASLDLPSLPEPERKGWQTNLDNARTQGLDKSADATAQSILRKPRALSDDETAGLALRLQQVKNAHADLVKEMSDDIEAGKDVESKRDRLHALEQSFDDLRTAARLSGTEKGRALSSQRLTVNKDYDLVSMLNRAKATRGRDLNPEERGLVEKQAQQVADLQKRLEESQAKPAIDAMRQESRRTGRAQKRETLEQEAATIKSNIAAEFARIKSQQGVMPSGLAGLDPEGAITKLALKYAKNRFDAGITKAGDLIDDVHAMLKDFVDVSRRQVAELVSGYKGLVKPETKRDLEKTIGDLRKEMRKELERADVEAGQIYARKAGPNIPKAGPRETKRQIQTRYQNQIAEYERRISEKDYSPTPKRGQTVLDPETEKIRLQLNQIKRQYDADNFHAKVLADWQARKPYQKILPYMAAGTRTAILSGVKTLGKIGSALGQRVPQQYAEEAAGKLAKRVFPATAEKAARYGGTMNLASEGAFARGFGQGVKEIPSLVKTGESELGQRFGDYHPGIPTKIGKALEVPGRLHMSEKNPLLRGEFERSKELLLQKADRLQPGSRNNPSVIDAAEQQAYDNAKEVILMGDNPFSRAFVNAQRSFSPAAKDLVRTIVPVHRVAGNYLNQMLGEYGLGLFRGAVRAIRERNPEVLGKLTPKEADKTMRLLQRGSLGMAYVALAGTPIGAALGIKAGGFYDKDRKGAEVKPQDVKIGPATISHMWLHSPPDELAQLTASMQQELAANKSFSKGAWSGAKRSTKGVLSQTPFVNELLNVSSALENGDSLSAWAGREVASRTEPQLMREIEGWRDTKNGEPVPRKAQGFTDQLKMGVPGLRETIPINTDKIRQDTLEKLIEKARSGQDVKSEVKRGIQDSTLKPADEKLIEREAAQSITQARFQRKDLKQAITEYEMMSPSQRAEVKDILSEKSAGVNLLRLDEQQAVVDRLLKLGFTLGAPQGPARPEGPKRPERPKAGAMLPPP